MIGGKESQIGHRAIKIRAYHGTFTIQIKGNFEKGFVIPEMAIFD